MGRGHGGVWGGYADADPPPPPPPPFFFFKKYKKPKFIQCFVFDAAGDVLTGDSEGNILTWTRAGDGRGVGKGGKGGGQ